jgi:hypothetical protein
MRSDTCVYIMRTPQGRLALAARDAATTAAWFDCQIEARLRQLSATFDLSDRRTLHALGRADPELSALVRARQRVEEAAVHLLAAGWVPAFVALNEIRWLPPGAEQRATTLRAGVLDPCFARRAHCSDPGSLAETREPASDLQRRIAVG